MITYTLTDTEPRQTRNGHTEGTQIHFEERDDGWYWCLSGVGPEGHYSETDDQGPFADLTAATAAALDDLQEDEPALALALLQHLIASGHHDINEADFIRRMGLNAECWSWDDIGPARIAEARQAIHAGPR